MTLLPLAQPIATVLFRKDKTIITPTLLCILRMRVREGYDKCMPAILRLSITSEHCT